MISLSLAKQHCRIDGNDEDELLQVIIDAVVSDCVAYLNRPLYVSDEAMAEAEKAGEHGGLVVNPSIVAAMLLAFGWLYANREGEAENGLPKTARHLLNPYRHLPGV